MEHNGHAWQKKHVVELYCFVAHAQYYATCIEEGEELGKEVNSAHVAGLNVTENQQDREDSGRRTSTERTNVARAYSHSPQIIFIVLS